MGKLIKKLKSNTVFFVFLIIFMSIVAFLMTFAFNNITIDIRLKELQSYLHSMNYKEQKTDYLPLVAKYTNLKRNYDGVISDHELNLEEIKSTFLIHNSYTKNIVKNNPTEKAALFFINGVRFILGKPPLQLLWNVNTDRYLDVAYFLERNRQYRDALKVYEEARRQPFFDKEKNPVILLHEGYCNAIIGNTGKANEKYQEIISNDSNGDIAIVAAILLKYLEDFKEYRDIVVSSDEASIEKSEKLVKLTAYNEALDILEGLKNEEDADKDRISYLQGRCFENIGRIENAVVEYQKIISDSDNKDYALKANRRLLVIGYTMHDRKDVIDLAHMNNELLRDDDFADYIEFSEKYVKDDNYDEGFYKLLSENSTVGESNNENEESDFTNFINDSKERITEKIDSEANKSSVTKDKPVKPVKRVKKVFSDNNKSSYNLEFYDNNILVRMEHYNADDKLEYYYVFHYDKSGERSGMDVFDANHNLLE